MENKEKKEQNEPLVASEPMPKLSIVLPYYNPIQGWELTILASYKAISEKLGFNPELVIVNDGSKVVPSKGSLSQLVSEIPCLITIGYKENRGKGAALRQGIARASGNKIIYTDVDFPYLTKSFLKIWEDLGAHDVVIGVKDEHYYKHLPIMRVWVSKILRKLIGLLFHMPITDTQCGLKGFNQKGKALFLQTTTNRYLCDLEFIYLCFKIRPKLGITHQEVSLRPEVKFSKMNTKILFTEALNLLSIVFKRKAKESF